jgi:flavin reductase (DIM6/NTAB) family NADH-FMN oxidoreductase RutF
MPAVTPDFDSSAFRAALGRFATGVAIVTTLDDKRQPVGLTVSSFNSVSLQPPLILWSLSLGSSSFAALDKCTSYTVNVLAAEQLDLARNFSTRKGADRFTGVPWRPGSNGSPIITGSTAWFECYNRSKYHEGDHCIFVGEVERCGHTLAMPLVFHAGDFDLTPQQGSRRTKRAV